MTGSSTTYLYTTVVAMPVQFRRCIVYHGVLPYAICRDGPKKKMAAKLKVHE